MSAEIPPTQSTNPVVPEPKDGPVKPDNQYQDIIIAEASVEGASPAAKKKAKPGTVEPDNQYQD